MKLRDIAPIGTRMSPAFVCRALGGRDDIEMLSVDVYPESPEAEQFRRARVDAGVNIREMARRLGLSPAEFSAVERGAKVPEDWVAFWRASGLYGGES